MRTYIIGNDGIALCRKAPATVSEGEIVVASKEELHAAPLSPLAKTVASSMIDKPRGLSGSQDATLLLGERAFGQTFDRHQGCRRAQREKLPPHFRFPPRFADRRGSVPHRGRLGFVELLIEPVSLPYGGRVHHFCPRARLSRCLTRRRAFYGAGQGSVGHTRSHAAV